jgi:hypothetical protein
MYIQPEGGRQEDNDFDPTKLNFSWSVNSFVKETMIVNLVFDYPLEISPIIK